MNATASDPDVATVDWGDDDSIVYAFRTCEGLPPAADPRAIAERVLEFDEHSHLVSGGASIDWLFRYAEKFRAGRKILGTCYIPRVQGDLSDLFYDMLMRLCGRVPDFLVVLDLEYWRKATALEREILCHHELLHAGQARDVFGAPRFDRDGLPIWALRAHDIEEFDDVVRRYGMHSTDVVAFLKAISDNLESGG